jgi:hypothetical protein
MLQQTFLYKHFEDSYIYPVAGKRKKRVEPAIHFAPILDYIKEDATQNYGYSVDPQQDTFSSHKPAAD